MSGGSAPHETARIAAAANANGSWQGVDGAIARHVAEQSNRCLRAYAENPLLVAQDANIEIATAEGGYGRKQLYELVQNGADALQGSRGRIAVVLTDRTLYCANEGMPLDITGVDALLASHLSIKRGSEIGRFGLGFKSVVALSRTPQFFSRSGSFGWDRDYARSRISTIVPDPDRWATLRVAQPLDPEEHGASDPVLNELMQWATTVVKLNLDVAGTDWLHHDVAEFPAEFLLFVPHVRELTLDDRVTGDTRHVALTRRGNMHTLVADGRRSKWRVFSTVHRPSMRAAADAGELARRDEIPLVWAVPIEGRAAVGQFWAFFPTSSSTTLRGILNAPWKTNEDRHDLLSGDFNEELLVEVAVPLVARALPTLLDADDLGAFLEILPARGRESRSWADAAINEPLYRALAGMPSLPDQNGVLRRPGDIKLPAGDVRPGWLELWESAPERPRNWIHSSAVRTAERRAKAERLAGGSVVELREWLEDLVTSQTAAASRAAVRVAARIVQDDPATRSSVAAARIVLTRDGQFVPATPGHAFVLPANTAPDERITYVSDGVTADDDALAALLQMDIGPVDASGVLHALLAQAGNVWREDDWVALWEALRQVDLERAVEVLGDRLSPLRSRLCVMTLAGTWEPLGVTLLPGRVVPANGSRDARVAIDIAFHERDLALLRRVGAVEWPTHDGGAGEAWLDDYRAQVFERYYAALPRHGSKPRRDLLRLEGPNPPGPLAMLRELSPQGRAVLSEAVVGIGSAKLWRCHHETNASYPTFDYEPPATWLVRREGYLDTSRGVVPIRLCVGPQLHSHGDVLPVARVEPEVAQGLRLPEELSEISESTWVALLEGLGDDDGLLGSLGALAARHTDAPPALRCRCGDDLVLRPPHEVVVATQDHEMTTLRKHSVPAVLTDEAGGDVLTARWRLRRFEDVISMHVAPIDPDPPRRLIDVVPPLRWLLGETDHQIELVTCRRLEIRTVTEHATTTESAACYIDASTVYWIDGTPLDRLVNDVSDAFGLDLSREVVASVADEARRKARRAGGKPPTPDLGSTARSGASVRFTGSCEILAADAERLAQVADRLLPLLAGVPGVELEVVVDVAANAMDGFPPDVVDAVKAVADELGFEDADFEEHP